MDKDMETAISFYLMKLPEVEKACAIKKSQIYKLIQRKDFPPPVALGSKARAWRSSDIQKWIKERPTADNFQDTQEASA